MSYRVTNLTLRPALNNSVSTVFNFALSVIVINTDNNNNGCTESMTKRNVLSFVNEFCSTADMPYLRFFYEHYDYDDLLVQVTENINEDSDVSTGSSTVTSSASNSKNVNVTSDCGASVRITGRNTSTQTHVTNIRSSILYMLTTNNTQLEFVKAKIKDFIS